MDKITLAALKKLYRYDNSDYDVVRGVSLYRINSLNLEERNTAGKTMNWSGSHMMK